MFPSTILRRVLALTTIVAVSTQFTLAAAPCCGGCETVSAAASEPAGCCDSTKRSSCCAEKTDESSRIQEQPVGCHCHLGAPTAPPVLPRDTEAPKRFDSADSAVTLPVRPPVPPESRSQLWSGCESAWCGVPARKLHSVWLI